MNPFARLPDEVLQEVFMHVPSLPKKFQLAAVSQQFRRNALQVIKKPIYLKLCFNHESINDYTIPHSSWPLALEVLAKRARFKSILIGYRCPVDVLDAFLNILNGKEHQNQVKKFYDSSGCSSEILEQFLVKCEKLDELTLEFPLSQVPYQHTEYGCDTQVIDLGAVLNNKVLSKLTLGLYEYSQEQLSAAFRSLAPNTLEQCRINILHHPVDLVQMMTEVPAVQWSALTRLELNFAESNDAQLGLFGLVARLPALQYFSIRLPELKVTLPFDKFSEAVMSLFNSRQRQQNQLKISFDECGIETTGCSVIQLFHTLQQRYPAFNFDTGNFFEFVFALGNTTLVCGALIEPCVDECEECRSFHQIVVRSLLDHATLNPITGHLLHNRRLDRCKVERVVPNMNEFLEDCKALLATVNEAQDLATVTLEMVEGNEQFYITVDCGQCFNQSCETCWPVE